VIGIDPSRKMLAQARCKVVSEGVIYACGTGEAIPLGKSIDLIFISMVFHHFSDSRTVTRECRRVLRPAGRVFVRTATVEQIPAYPYLPFIPASRTLLEQRLPQLDVIREVFEAAGFETASTEIVVQQIAPTYAAYVKKLEAGGDSILATLNSTDLVRGLSAIRDHASRMDPQPVAEPINVLVFR
jgi:SAM-dependent methyltransferase